MFDSLKESENDSSFENTLLINESISVVDKFSSKFVSLYDIFAFFNEGSIEVSCVKVLFLFFLFILNESVYSIFFLLTFFVK